LMIHIVDSDTLGTWDFVFTRYRQFVTSTYEFSLIYDMSQEVKTNQ
jgi:hypothetical protein